MASLIEEMRSKPEVVMTETIVGVDPDLHQCGLALVTARTSSKEATRILRLQVFSLSVHKRLKGAKAVEAMACLMKELGEHQAATSVDAVFIESQRIYPEDDIPKLVGQGNDLIQLAQVAGMATQVFWPRDPERLHMELPQDWKGQAKKVAMHAQAMRMLRAHETVITYCPRDQEFSCECKLPWELPDDAIIDKIGSHGMDAACLALWGVGK